MSWCTNRFGQNNKTNSFSYLLINLTVSINQNGPKYYADVAQQKGIIINTTLQHLNIII